MMSSTLGATTNDNSFVCEESPRRIDTHYHIIPEFYAKALESSGGLPNGWPIPKWSLEKAKEQMSQLGIETGIASIVVPKTMFDNNDKEKGRVLVRQLNEYSADLVKKNPKQFGFFATLPPLTDMEGTLKEIDYVQSTLKPDGYTLVTSYDDGLYLGHPSFQPIWSKLNELKAVVFIHPTEGCTSMINQYLLPPLLDYPLETTRTVADLVVTGTRAMFPDVKIILAHAGGTIPFLANRISLAGIIPSIRCPRNNQEILEDFRSFYFDTALSTSDPQLQALMAFADPSKILFGSDIPYAPLPVALANSKNLDRFFLKTKSDQNLWQDVNRNNAQRLLSNRLQD